MSSSVGAGIFQEPQIIGDGIVILPFSFVPNGTSNPDSTLIKGTWGIASIVYTSADMWTVTLQAKFKSVLAYTWGISCDAAGTAQGFKIELDTTNTDVTTGTVVLASVNASGTRATIAATNSPRINVVLYLATSAIPGCH